MKRPNSHKSLRQPATRRIGIVAFPGSQILDIAGPMAVFAEANQLCQPFPNAKQAPYQVELISTESDRLVDCYCGVNITAQTDFRSARGKFDTLLIAGGYGGVHVEKIAGFLPWLRKTSNAARRIGSVCGGAFALAAAGLLDGRRATTHWYFCPQMVERFPAVQFDPDPIFICDGNVYTSAGVTAGIDLSLALVEEDLGAELALRVARALVVFLRRPGSQSQFSASLSLQTSDRTPIRELQAWLLDNLREPLTVERMAAQAGMSARNFARVFAEQIGMTPARFLMQIRVEAARRRLEESTQSIELIAEECGFGSPESMRSAFQRLLRVSPQEYRKRFHLAEQGEHKDESTTQSPGLRQSSDGRDHQRRHRPPARKPGKGKNRREQTAS
ncbi:MAG TPA: GlxA family transcriptional regulator [Blastocatellia bacterium]|nr:GlxA family transcriptional regulator [Blastocatellia bacterium]